MFGKTLYLNLAGGKISSLGDKFLLKNSTSHLMNVDLSYDLMHDDIKDIERNTREYSCSHYNIDIWKFLENLPLTFKGISIYRFMEHIPLNKMLYFIYLLSTATERGSYIDVIVPNYQLLSDMILNEDIVYTERFKDDCPYNEKFQAHDILVTTELLNEPYCPHASIWTPRRAKYYFEMEGRFIVKDMHSKFEFDGRDIYMRFTAERV